MWHSHNANYIQECGSHFSLESKAINGITFPKNHSVFQYFIHSFCECLRNSYSSSFFFLLILFCAVVVAAAAVLCVHFVLLYVLCLLWNRYLLCMCIHFLSAAFFCWFNTMNLIRFAFRYFISFCMWVFIDHCWLIFFSFSFHFSFSLFWFIHFGTFSCFFLNYNKWKFAVIKTETAQISGRCARNRAVRMCLWFHSVDEEEKQVKVKCLAICSKDFSWK